MDAIGTQYTHETPMDRVWEFSSRLFANKSFNWIWILVVRLSVTSLVNSSLSLNFAGSQNIIKIRKWLKQLNHLWLLLYTHKLRGFASKLTLKTAYLWHRFAPSVLTLRLPGSSDTTVLAYNVDLWTCRHAKCPKWCQITIRGVGSTRLYTAYTVDTVYTFQNAKYWMGWTGLGGWIPQYTVITTRAPSVLIKDVSVFN